jgi:hypothetical protein
MAMPYKLCPGATYTVRVCLNFFSCLQMAHHGFVWQFILPAQSATSRNPARQQRTHKRLYCSFIDVKTT